MLHSGSAAASRGNGCVICAKASLILLLLALIGVIAMQHVDNQSIVEPTAKKFNMRLAEKLANPTEKGQLDPNYVTKSFNIYIIVSPARQEYVRNVLKNLNWDSHAKLIRGIAKAGLVKSDLVKDGVLRSEKSKYIPGRVACVLSHKKALEAFLGDDKAERALILEDDIMKNPLLTHSPDLYIQQVMADIPHDWNFVNFGRCWDWCYSEQPVVTDEATSKKSTFAIRSKNPLCTHAYAVTKDGAETIVQDLLPLKLLNIDQYIARLVRDKKLTGYAAKVPILLQNKKTTGSIAAPDTMHPYRLCATLPQEMVSKVFDTKWHGLAKDGMFGGLIASDGLLMSDGFLMSDGLLMSDGFLMSDGLMMSDGVMQNNKMLRYLFSSGKKERGDLYY